MTTVHALTVGFLAGVLLVTVLVLPFLMWDTLTMQAATLDDEDLVDPCGCGPSALHHPSCLFRGVAR